MVDQIERAIDLVLEQDQDEFLEALKDGGRIDNYLVIPNGLVDVMGNVDLFNMELKEIPVKFGIVAGFFDCSHNQLTSLQGAPERVEGCFDCSHNQVTSLEGSPEEVGLYFDCSHNQLTTLRGCPEKLGEVLYCYDNPVYFTHKDIELAKQGKAPLGLPLSFVLMKKKEKAAMGKKRLLLKNLKI